MPDPSPTKQPDDSILSQLIVLFGIILGLGLFISPVSQNTTRELTVDYSNTLEVISNPQITQNDSIKNNDEQPSMPVAMFNLENPNGWDTPQTVTLVGTLQDELGCTSDMDIRCMQSQMTYDTLGDIWRASYELPAGSYTYHISIDQSETHIYGQNGIAGKNSQPIILDLDDPSTVHFYYDHKTGWITDDINSIILTLPSNFQDEIGCKQEWNASCFRTWMQDIDNDGIYTFETLLIPGGSWETRIAINGNFETSYGQGGTFQGDNIPLWIPNIGHLSVFTWDSNLKTLTIFVSNMPIRLSTDLPPIAPNE